MFDTLQQNAGFHNETMVGEKMLNPWLSLPLDEPFILADDEQIGRRRTRGDGSVGAEPYAGRAQAV